MGQDSSRPNSSAGQDKGKRGILSKSSDVVSERSDIVYGEPPGYRSRDAREYCIWGAISRDRVPKTNLSASETTNGPPLNYGSRDERDFCIWVAIGWHLIPDLKRIISFYERRRRNTFPIFFCFIFFSVLSNNIFTDSCCVLLGRASVVDFLTCARFDKLSGRLVGRGRGETRRNPKQVLFGRMRNRTI